MSHFACLVVGENVYQQMLPFKENQDEYIDSIDVYLDKFKKYCKNSNANISFKDYISRILGFNLVNNYDDANIDSNFAVVNPSGKVESVYAYGELKSKWDNFCIGGRYAHSLKPIGSENLLIFGLKNIGNDLPIYKSVTRLSSRHSLAFRAEERLILQNSSLLVGDQIVENDKIWCIESIIPYGVDSALKRDRLESYRTIFCYFDE